MTPKSVGFVATFARPLSSSFPPQQIPGVIELLIEQIQLSSQALDLGFCAAVDIKIQFTAKPILCVLAILTHHDDRSLKGRKHG
jgi:hypothetical protein